MPREKERMQVVVSMCVACWGEMRKCMQLILVEFIAVESEDVDECFHSSIFSIPSRGIDINTCYE